MTITAVLFDLDGTLVDTAPDLAHALNLLREKHQLAPLSYALIRPHVGYGVKALLKMGLEITDEDPRYTAHAEEFLQLYHTCLTNTTEFFPGMDKVLLELEQKKIPWGIVTNKPARFTYDILKALKLEHRAACIICGDSLSRRKPDPDQILHACELLQKKPENCLYIGDTETDAKASRAAGTKIVIALYGYTHEHENPYHWHADGYIKEPLEIMDWLTRENVTSE